MEYTSAEAGKLLRKLNEEKNQLESMEQRSSMFNAALGEDGGMKISIWSIVISNSGTTCVTLNKLIVCLTVRIFSSSSMMWWIIQKRWK